MHYIIKKNLLALLITSMMSLIISIIILLSFYKYILKEEVRSSEIDILSAFDLYAEFLKHSRVITERYDRLLGNHEIDSIIRQEEHNHIESLMLQSSFALSPDYFVLRSMNGKTRIEFKRGAINKNKNQLYIHDENSFLSLKDIFLVRNCNLNGTKYICLVDIPNITETVTTELRTYTAIALSIPELLMHIRYRDLKFHWNLFSPIINLDIDNLIIKLSSKDDKINFFKVTKPITDGIKLIAGYSIKIVIASVTILTIVLTYISMIIILSVNKRLKKRLETQTENAILQEKLKSLNDIQQLIKGVIHDIRSPLGVLDLLAQSISEDSLKKDLKQLTKRMQSILCDLEIKQKRSLNDNYSLIPLAILLTHLTKEKENEFGDSVAIIFDKPTQEFWCKGNYSDIFRVMSNIINNARQASENKKRIWISINNLENKKIQVSIRDEGKGIACEIRDRIFQEGATYGKENGSGFGLFNAKKILEQMGGEITFITEINHGTIFYISIPLQDKPIWAVENINLSNVDELIIIDDEPWYYEFWKRKINAISKKSILYFDHPSKISPDLLSNNRSLKIIDNNFGPDIGKGIIFIDNSYISNYILMTSDWLLPEVQRFAEQKKFLLLGKECLDEISIYD